MRDGLTAGGSGETWHSGWDGEEPGVPSSLPRSGAGQFLIWLWVVGLNSQGNYSLRPVHTYYSSSAY